MPLSPFHRWLFALLLLAVAIYCALGVMQALSISHGQRAIWNINLWLSGWLLATVLAWLVAPIHLRQSQRSSIAKRLVPWAHFAIATVAAWSIFSHILAVDACLDRGGSYNYLVSSCSLVETSSFMPLYQSHGFPIVASVVFAFLAYSTPSRTAFRSDGGQDSAVMADTVPR
jgi:hypothetical protein